MGENKSLLIKSAMSYGFLLGIFWVIKYIFFAIGFTSPTMQMIYWILTPMTLVFAVVFTLMYKISIGGKMSFFHAWQYGVLLYFFAALIVSLAHYAFYRYFAPPDLIASSMNQAIEMMKMMDMSDQMKEVIVQMPTPTPIQMTIQGIFANVFYGIILSIPVAALLYRNNLTMQMTKKDQQEEDNT